MKRKRSMLPSILASATLMNFGLGRLDFTLSSEVEPRAKTKYDLEAIEKALRKRERKAAKKMTN